MSRGYQCMLCGESREGYGNNPAPLSNTGLCCDSCNHKVVRERFRRANRERSILEVTDKLYQICENFGIDEEFVQDVRGYIDEQIMTQAGIDVNTL